MQILWRRCLAAGVAVATILCPTSWGVILMLTPRMKLIGLPCTKLLHFLFKLLTWPCDLDLWPFDLGVMSRDAQYLYHVLTGYNYRSRVRTTTILHWPPIFTFFGIKEVKFQISSF